MFPRILTLLNGDYITPILVRMKDCYTASAAKKHPSVGGLFKHMESSCMRGTFLGSLVYSRLEPCALRVVPYPCLRGFKGYMFKHMEVSYIGGTLLGSFCILEVLLVGGLYILASMSLFLGHFNS